MSRLTDYLAKPQSVLADVVISVAVGAAAYVAFGLFLGWLPFSDALAPATAGVVGALVYKRARDNLTKQPPKFPE